MNNNKKEFGLISLILVIIATAILTSLTTGLILYNNDKESEIGKLKNDEFLQEFITVYTSVLDNYYEDIDKSKMINEAIEAMLNYLGDDYTTYLNEEETENLAEKLAGKYKGIGVELAQGNKINKVFENSPAANSGLQEGDTIISINNTDVTTYAASEIANVIKESKEEKINIKVIRNSEELLFEVDVKELYIPSVTSQIIEENDKKIGYISISTFSNTVYEQLKKELNSLEEQNINSLILDVRNNTGGYLKAASDIASLFLEKGKTIYSLEGKKSKEVYKDETKEKRDYKVVVLINEASASASEILAAALKESYNAILVGKKSYGKGKVQQTHSLSENSMFKYTSAKWLTPLGTCIDQIGLQPDYEVDLQMSEDGKVIVDTQLEQAINLLRE